MNRRTEAKREERKLNRMATLVEGGSYRGKKILDAIHLSNGWVILKTENKKSVRDFKVRTVYQLLPRVRTYTPKHAHFAIDFYGKLCSDKVRAMQVFQAIIEVWNGKPVSQVVGQLMKQARGLPGYDIEYILHALNWILEQEDINFKGRPGQKQKELDSTLQQLGIIVPSGRLGSELAISLLCNIALGIHPVEAFIKANLDVLPAKRGRGAI